MSADRRTRQERRRRRARRGWVAAGAVVLAALFAAVALLPPVLYPPLTAVQLAADDLTTKESLDAQTARYELQQNARAGMVQAAGGVIAISGAVLAWLRFRSERVDRREDTHASLFVSALADLREESLETRVGALYVLDDLADRSERHSTACAHVLLAFLRRNSPWPPPRDSPRAGPEPPAALPADIQAALLVLVSRPAGSYGLTHLPLADLDLRSANLMGAHLERADLRRTRLDDAHLEQARLTGADLTDTRLPGAHLEGSDLRGAFLDGTQMLGSTATGWSIRGATFRGPVSWPDLYDDDTAAQADGAVPLAGSEPVVGPHGRRN